MVGEVSRATRAHRLRAVIADPFDTISHGDARRHRHVTSHHVVHGHGLCRQHRVQLVQVLAVQDVELTALTRACGHGVGLERYYSGSSGWFWPYT